MVLHEEGVEEGLHPKGSLPPSRRVEGEVLNEQPSCCKGEKDCGKPSLPPKHPSERDKREEDRSKHWELLHNLLHFEKLLPSFEAVHQCERKAKEVLEAMAKRTVEMVTPSVSVQAEMPFSNQPRAVVLLSVRSLVWEDNLPKSRLCLNTLVVMFNYNLQFKTISSKKMITKLTKKGILELGL